MKRNRRKILKAFRPFYLNYFLFVFVQAFVKYFVYSILFSINGKFVILGNHGDRW